MRRWGGMIGRGACVAALGGALLATAAVPPTATAARIPAYREPADYKGLAKAPVKAPLPTPPAIPLSAGGTFPDTLVDEAGTAHIVWNEGRGDEADVAVYCRLKRAASACDGPPVELRWDKDYGAGDSPAFNVDNEGPKIIRVGDQLVVLSHRYPTGAQKPDGTTSSDTVVAWTSSDGGQNWTKASIVGRYALGEVGLIGTGNMVRIINLGQDPLCPGMCVEEFRSGEYSGTGGNLAVGPDQAYYATLAVANGVPTAAWGDLKDQVFLRRYTGAGSVLDPGTWTQSPGVPGSEPSLAAGPAGTYLMSRAPLTTPSRKPFTLRPVTDAGAGALAAGAATTISTADDVQFGRLTQDLKGNLIAAWEQREGKDPGVKLRGTALPVTPGGAVPAGLLNPAQTLVTGKDNGQIALAAAADGGGFAVLNHTGGINQAGQIVATGFGAVKPTNEAGLGDLPGNGRTGKSCQNVEFGSFDIEATTCLYNGTGADARKISTGGEVDLMGLKIIPDVGSTLVIDPDKLRLDVIGQVRVLVRAPVVGDVVLWHGKLNVDLSTAKPGSTLFDFPIGEYAAKILGFDIGADIKVRLEKDGVHIPMSLKLPAAFLGASASTEFVADRANGLKLSSLHLHLGPVPLGAVTLENFDLLYDPGSELWQGDGKLAISGAGAIEAGASFKMGQFNGATIKFDPTPPITIGPFVYLLHAGGGFTVDPLHIEVEAAVGGGAAVNGKSPVRVDGKATADFPANGPGRFQIDGRVSLLIFEVAEGRLRYQTDGYADFNVQTHQDFEVLVLNGAFDGFIDGTTGSAAASFKGEACVGFGFGCLVGAGLSGAVSDKGLAICGSLSLGDLGDAIPKGPDGRPVVPPDASKGGSLSAGVQFTLEGLKDAGETLAATPGIAVPAVGAGIVLAHTHIPCHTGDFYVPPPRALRADGPGGAVTVDVKPGLPSQTVLVTGVDGLPAIDLTGPGGKVITGATASQRGVRSAGGTSVAVPNANSVLFALDAPQGGAWTVTPRAGSPAIKQVQLSNGYRPAAATAVIRTQGRLKRLAYRITNLGAGQSVRFVESGAFGTRVLGTANRPIGTIPLVARGLPGGPRVITAEIQRDGVATDKKVVARYQAPRVPPPALVSGLKVIRRGSTVTVTWRRTSAGAARQMVRLIGAKGTRLLTLVRATSRLARFSGVRADERLTVEVSGLTATNGRGPVRRAVSIGRRT